VIGNGLLDRFKLIVDYSRKRVILEPSERFNDPTDFDFFMFKIVRDNKTYRIGDMLPASMTAEAGLKIGDVLLAIDGKPVSDSSLIQIQRMFMLDGRVRILFVKRGEEMLKIKLETFRIF
jgi:C-terminal processing protease CtpA/Prc